MKRYDVWIEPAVHQARKHLPGHFRQRVKRVIDQVRRLFKVLGCQRMFYRFIYQPVKLIPLACPAV